VCICASFSKESERLFGIMSSCHTVKCILFVSELRKLSFSLVKTKLNSAATLAAAMKNVTIVKHGTISADRALQGHVIETGTTLYSRGQVYPESSELSELSSS
jgi:uncharacterized membrane protein